MSRVPSVDGIPHCGSDPSLPRAGLPKLDRQSGGQVRMKQRLSIPGDQDGDRLDSILKVAGILEMRELCWDYCIVKYLLVDGIGEDVGLGVDGERGEILGAGSHNSKV